MFKVHPTVSLGMLFRDKTENSIKYVDKLKELFVVFLKIRMMHVILFTN